MIFALDLATTTGFAFGKAGAKPISGSVVLKQRGDAPAIAYNNLASFLINQWAELKPGLVVKEAPIPLQAFKNLGNAAHTVNFTIGLHAIVTMLCVRMGIRCEDVPDSTVRKHFIGAGRLGDRATTKAAVIQRCQALGYIPKDCTDDNRADACAVWDWATATYGRARPKELHLFGERATA